jgi:dephospho-CoA kinase
MKKIAITGQIGSGKTHISNLFKNNLNIPIFDSDSVVKDLYNNDIYIKTKMIEWFGNEIYVNNEINKQVIADIIFNDDLAMTRIVKLIKGGLIRSFHDWCYEIEYLSDNTPPFIIYESAVLDKEIYGMFDLFLVVDADREIREKRVLMRSGLNKQKFNERDSKQIKTEDITKKLTKMMIPYHVIQNNGKDLMPLLKTIAITIHHLF